MFTCSTTITVAMYLKKQMLFLLNSYELKVIRKRIMHLIFFLTYEKVVRLNCH